LMPHIACAYDCYFIDFHILIRLVETRFIASL
jgi:hypothetical protein